MNGRTTDTMVELN